VPTALARKAKAAEFGIREQEVEFIPVAHFESVVKSAEVEAEPK